MFGLDWLMTIVEYICVLLCFYLSKSVNCLLKHDWKIEIVCSYKANLFHCLLYLTCCPLQWLTALGGHWTVHQILCYLPTLYSKSDHGSFKEYCRCVTSFTYLLAAAWVGSKCWEEVKARDVRMARACSFRTSGTLFQLLVKQWISNLTFFIVKHRRQFIGNVDNVHYNF